MKFSQSYRQQQTQLSIKCKEVAQYGCYSNLNFCRPLQLHNKQSRVLRALTAEQEAIQQKWMAPKVKTMTYESTGLSVTSNFDSGNIEVVDIRPNPKGGQVVDLQIESDTHNDAEDISHSMWFYFRISATRGVPLQINIVNIDQTTYPGAWDGYQMVMSYDMIKWERVPADDCCFDKTNMTYSCNITPKHHSIYFAHFAPFSYEEHLRLVARMQVEEQITHCPLGQTADGHEMDLLIARSPDLLPQGANPTEPVQGVPKVWVVARQHAGETMSEFFVQGMLEALIDAYNPVARLLLKRAEIYIIPNMNPDGTWRGNFRTNAQGADLNREWGQSSDPTQCAEVALVESKMRATGVNLFLDVHGEAAHTSCFMAGPQGTPSWDSEREKQYVQFVQMLRQHNPDFTEENLYPVEEKGTADMRVACHSVCEEFKCVGGGLEMPVKDADNQPDVQHGWSPKRSMRLGQSILVPMLHFVEQLEQE